MRVFAHREEAWSLFAAAALSRSSMEGRGPDSREAARLADEMLQELEVRVAKWRCEEDQQS